MKPEELQTPTPQQPQSAPIPQPAVSAETVTGMRVPTRENMEQQKKIALVVAIATILIFIAGIIFGYVWIFTAFLGAISAAIGIRTKSTLITILGIIGTVLNLGLWVIVLIAK